MVERATDILEHEMAKSGRPFCCNATRTISSRRSAQWRDNSSWRGERDEAHGELDFMAFERCGSDVYEIGRRTKAR
jgi:hypothetical protein